MAKTNFAPGTIVSTAWLNGAKNITFDGRDEDWHYPQLTPKSLNLSAMGLEFLRLEGDQTVEGLKVFSTLPQSTKFAENDNDFLTLKDVTGEERGFLQIRCTTPSDGMVAVYDEDLGSWKCTNVINGGTY